MIDVSRLPFLPLHFFYFSWNKVQQRLFLLLLAVLVLTAGSYAALTAFPEYFSLQVNEVPELSNAPVAVRSVQHNYQTFDLTLNAYRQTATYAASPLAPAPTPLVAFVVLQVLGWGIALTMFSYMRTVWVYGFYALFAVWLHFSQVFALILPGTNAVAVELLLYVLLLGGAYAFQAEWLRWNLLARLATLLGTLAAAFGLAYAKAGLLGFHEIARSTFPVNMFVGLCFAFFIAKEPTNLIFFAATNRPNPAERLKVPFLLGVCLLWLVAAVLMLAPYLGWMEGAAWLRPAYLLAIAAVFTVFFSQNQFHFVDNLFPKSFEFSMVVLAWAVIALSHWLFSVSYGGYDYMMDVERNAAMFFVGIGAMHILYTFSNHLPLLQMRVHLYYLLTNGPKFRFVVVWLGGIIITVFLQGLTGWRTFSIFIGEQIAMDADHESLAGNNEVAQRYYQRVTEILPPAVRANYNLAGLLMAKPDIDRVTIAEAFRRYQQATEFIPFPYARLNAANLLLINQQYDDAINLLKTDGDRSPNRYVLNNLAMLYRAQQKPDMAIATLKQALSLDSDFATAHSNLAEIYFENNKRDWAEKFTQAAMDSDDEGSTAQLNGLFHILHDGFKVNAPDAESDKAATPALAYNRLLYLVKTGKVDAATKRVRQIANETGATDAIVLDAYLLFARDSAEFAVTRADFVAKSFPETAKQAYYVVGLGFLEREVPEMAGKFFRTAYQNGNAKAGLYAAKLDMELGRRDSAYTTLSRLRVQHTDLWQDVSRELAVLLQAYNQPVFAETEFPAAKFSYEDRIRIGIIADSTNRYITALEAFRQCLAMDSSKVAPYIELSKIYNRYGNPKALESLEYPMKKFPQNNELKLAAAEAYVQAGKLGEANQLLQPLLNDAVLGNRAKVVEAKRKYLLKDTDGAIALLKGVWEKNPLDSRTALMLFNWYEAKGDIEQANAVATQAVNLNSENAALWEAYALASRQFSMANDAGFGALRAIELSPSQAEKLRIATAYAEEIRLVAVKPN